MPHTKVSVVYIFRLISIFFAGFFFSFSKPYITYKNTLWHILKSFWKNAVILRFKILFDLHNDFQDKRKLKSEIPRKPDVYRKNGCSLINFKIHQVPENFEIGSKYLKKHRKKNYINLTLLLLKCLRLFRENFRESFSGLFWTHNLKYIFLAKLLFWLIWFGSIFYFGGLGDNPRIRAWSSLKSFSAEIIIISWFGPSRGRWPRNGGHPVLSEFLASIRFCPFSSKYSRQKK